MHLHDLINPQRIEPTLQAIGGRIEPLDGAEMDELLERVKKGLNARGIDPETFITKVSDAAGRAAQQVTENPYEEPARVQLALHLIENAMRLEPGHKVTIER